MSTAELDRLCDEAMRRIRRYIAHSAGQHLRAMRKSWRNTVGENKLPQQDRTK